MVGDVLVFPVVLHHCTCISSRCSVIFFTSSNKNYDKTASGSLNSPSIACSGPSSFISINYSPMKIFIKSLHEILCYNCLKSFICG
jgi:hypothetical protein